MEKETNEFDVEVNGLRFTVKPMLSGTDYAVLHEVWECNILLFILQPFLSAFGNPGWQLTYKYNGQLMDKRLATKISEAIENHDL